MNGNPIGKETGKRSRFKFAGLLWNIKYLKGFKWHHLNQEEKFQEEIKRARLRNQLQQAERIDQLYLEKVFSAKKNRKRKLREEQENKNNEQDEQLEEIINKNKQQNEEPKFQFRQRKTFNDKSENKKRKMKVFQNIFNKEN